MNLILWRHGAAHEDTDEENRRLTTRGHRQVAQMSQWLHSHLPADFSLFCSPAVRAQQTARALASEFKVVDALAPGGQAAEIPALFGWPDSRGTIVVVGHQPTLGRLASLLLVGVESDWSIKKGAIWWIANRDRDEGAKVLLRAVVTPDFA